MTGPRPTCCRFDDQIVDSRTCIASSVSSSYEVDLRAMHIVAGNKSNRLGWIYIPLLVREMAIKQSRAWRQMAVSSKKWIKVEQMAGPSGPVASRHRFGSDRLSNRLQG